MNQCAHDVSCNACVSNMAMVYMYSYSPFSIATGTATSETNTFYIHDRTGNKMKPIDVCRNYTQSQIRTICQWQWSSIISLCGRTARGTATAGTTISDVQVICQWSTFANDSFKLVSIIQYQLQHYHKLQHYHSTTLWPPIGLVTIVGINPWNFSIASP